jgi:pimeloyl-ACP methyl ester carboxylesterase
MRRITAFFAAAMLASAALFAPGAAGASHLPNKTVVLIGGAGYALGEMPWEVLREQFELRGFPRSQVLEFQYGGGAFGPDGSWNPRPGGTCESYSKASFLALRQMMSDLVSVRPDHEIFLVGHGMGGFVATQALWAAAFQQDDPAIWQNLSGIASINGPMSGLSTERVALLGTASGGQCVDLTMLAWAEEVGKDPERYATTEGRAAKAVELGYKIGSFGNAVDCLYYYASPAVCPKLTERAGSQAPLLRLAGDERQTMYAKSGSISREYNLVLLEEDEEADNHRAVLVSTGPMAEVAEYVLSQSR